MAISFVGSAEGSTTSSADITLTLPAMLQGDVVYVLGGHAGLGALSVSTSGYSEIVTDLPVFSDTAEAAVFRKVQGASPDANVVVTSDRSSVCAIAIVLRGVDQTTPEDATPTSAQGELNIPNAPAIVTVTAGAWVLTLAVSQIPDTTITAPTGYSNQVDIQVNPISGGNDLTVGGATKLVASPGTEDAAAWTNWSVGDNVAIAVAVRPAAAAIPIPAFMANYRRRREGDT